MQNLTTDFGADVFSPDVMRARLSPDAYTALMQARAGGAALDRENAQCIADAMLAWAVERGATHYTHWFQPLTGVTAEKHDSFLQPNIEDENRPIAKFSWKNLARGESDASSFPSGGLRAAFEARGYTTWDPTSDAFVKNNSLYIPTAFCSYSGEALDEKTPLLRSMRALSDQACRVLKCLGIDAQNVYPTAGPEQEYFLIDKEVYRQRPDLVVAGRALFGVRPPKGQELTEHYFGRISARVWRFMRDVDARLWRLGVYATTRHNEAAPCQHELAVVFDVCNLACDRNQLVMEVLEATAEEHGFVCLLHEKPFAHVNGSGKHNNWSLCCDGENLLSPGKNPRENMRFMLFLCAVISAADKYADLLRAACAEHSNDCRLGGSEAPPAIISVFLGENLTAELAAAAQGQTEAVEQPRTMLGAMPVTADFADRNRTAPLAFTGDKFEFRMLGASASASFVNTVLNTVVADELGELADYLEKGFEAKKFIKKTLEDHGRVLYSGNNYDPAWRQEALNRGLPELPTAADALPCLLAGKNIELFERHNVLSETELKARHDTHLNNYNREIRMEAYTFLDMAHRAVLPAAQEHLTQLLPLNIKRFIEDAEIRLDILTKAIDALEQTIAERPHGDQAVVARYGVSDILPAMENLRSAVDELERHVPGALWPYPTFAQILL
ncbi:MAG: glutamine synthetase III [Clostridia bacterium]|nr:glutamine synthetase III [Clostridia bacterium]